jgi:hypothetical protein
MAKRSKEDRYNEHQETLFNEEQRVVRAHGHRRTPIPDKRLLAILTNPAKGFNLLRSWMTFNKAWHACGVEGHYPDIRALSPRDRMHVCVEIKSGRQAPSTRTILSLMEYYYRLAVERKLLEDDGRVKTLSQQLLSQTDRSWCDEKVRSGITDQRDRDSGSRESRRRGSRGSDRTHKLPSRQQDH